MEQWTTDWTARWAIYSPHKIALKEWESGRTLTYGALNAQGDALASYCSDHFGLKKGDRVAVLADNCLEYVALFAAAQKAGTVLVPLNYRLAPAEIDYQLQNCDPQLVISESKYQSLLDEAPGYIKIKARWSLEELSEYLQESTGKTDLFPARTLEPDHPVFILYTSGTTGFPKGALYTHGMLFWNSVNTALSLILNSESRTINFMPPFHTGGWNVLTTPLLHRGGYTCLFKKFDAAAGLRALETEQSTIFMGVPTMLRMLAAEPAFDAADLSTLLYAIVGGEPMPIPLIEQWHNRGVAIRQGFGMTEAGPNLTSLHQDDAVRKKGSIGRPNFYVQYKLVGPDGKQVPPGEAGELLLRGPMVTPGYWRNPEATQKSIVDGWYHSGDMLREDEAGYLYVVDRIKNMFISGGENVYPAEVERVINQHPAVKGVVVLGVPDPKWGEVGRAFVVTTESGGLQEEALLEHCRQHLARYKVPKSVVFLTELPLSPSGKIDRRRLQQDA